MLSTPCAVGLPRSFCKKLPVSMAAWPHNDAPKKPHTQYVSMAVPRMVMVVPVDSRWTP